MKLKEYIKELQNIEKEHGGNLDVVYSSDAEGNSYDKVYYTPSVGNYNDREWVSLDNDEDFGDRKVNAVIVN